AYIGFHFFLQRLWDALGELPSVFPDGRRIAEYVPASVIALAPARLDEFDADGVLDDSGNTRLVVGPLSDRTGLARQLAADIFYSACGGNGRVSARQCEQYICSGASCE